MFLKRTNWWKYALLSILLIGNNIFMLASSLNCYDEDAWYSKSKNWFYGFLCLIYPGIIMFIIFHIEMLCKTAYKLKIPGHELYNNVYIWLLLLIIPVFGWILLLIMYLYLQVYIVIYLKNGNGEKYISE